MVILRGVIATLGIFLFWQLSIWIWQFPPYILPSPLAVADAWWQAKMFIGAQSAVTILETLAGLFLGIGCGIFAALSMIFLKPLRLWLLPLLLISQAIPTFAIAPILVIWLGYGMASKVATAVIMIFFPVTTAFYDGLKQTPQNYLDLAKTLHANAWRILLKIRIPAALPALASGIRVATAIAPIGAVIGEWVGASQGLGFLMLNANARMEIPLMFAALFTLVLFTLILYFSVDAILKHVIKWKI